MIDQRFRLKELYGVQVLVAGAAAKSCNMNMETDVMTQSALQSVGINFAPSRTCSLTCCHYFHHLLFQLVSINQVNKHPSHHIE